MSEFDELLEAIRDENDPDERDRLTSRLAELTAASPVRRERDEAKTQAQQALERAEKAEKAALKASFERLGITANPDALKVPGDIDVTDVDAIRQWAVSSSLLPTETKGEEAAGTQERVAQAAQAGVGAPPIQHVDDLLKMHKLVQKVGPNQLMSLYPEAMAAIEKAGLQFGSVQHSTDFEPIPDWGSRTPS